MGRVGAVNSTRLNLDQVTTIGDERRAKQHAKDAEYESVVRAYRQLSTHLLSQEMSEVADTFSYRAQVVQQKFIFHQRQLGR